VVRILKQSIEMKMIQENKFLMEREENANQNALCIEKQKHMNP
jgi:hypothetical protein